MSVLLWSVLSITLARLSWTVLSKDPDHLREYTTRDPNAYRFYDQLLLRLHKRPLSFQSWLSLTWLCVMFSMYLILPFDPLLLVGFIYMSMTGNVRHAPMYLLLLLTAFVHPVFLVPLALVKEVGAWMAVGVLLIQGRFVDAGVYGVIGLISYVILRRRVGPRPRMFNVAPFFTPRYAFNLFRQRRIDVLLDTMVSATLIIVTFWSAPLLFLWSAPPILLFSLWWEPQLWFPLVVLVLAGLLTPLVAPELLIIYILVGVVVLGIGATRKNFDSRRYWNQRYNDGGTSGPSSVGTQRDWKWGIIDSYVSVEQSTVLDLGCGDLSFWGERSAQDYLGMDISEEVVRMNGGKMTCMVMDLTETIGDLGFDVVFCQDVLFHQPSEVAFFSILENMNRQDSQFLFVTNYREPLRHRAAHMYYWDLDACLDKLDTWQLLQRYDDGPYSLYVLKKEGEK